MARPRRARLASYARPRTRLVATAGAVGAAAGAATVGTLLWAGDPAFASRKAFAVGAIFLGIGLLGWAGSIMAGEGIEAMQRHLDVRSGWTETKSRRAMARVGSFGAGWMAGAAAATVLLTA